MHIREILDNATQNKKPSLSFEFFPPKTRDSSQRLFKTVSDLVSLDPSFVSVTYGAGGSTRELTHDLVLKLHSDSDITVIPHLTMVNTKKAETRDIVHTYYKEGIKNIMALRGDAPKSEEYIEPEADFKYAADLVRLIRTECAEAGIGVAGFPEGHPATPNKIQEMEYLKQKVLAGADYIVTQLFFDNSVFYRFLDLLQYYNIKVPVIAGIMPITSRNGLYRMAELSGNTFFPVKLLSKIENASDDSEVQKVGIEWATRQVEDLIGNRVNGIHFYTLNQSLPTVQIYQDLNLEG